MATKFGRRNFSGLGLSGDITFEKVKRRKSGGFGAGMTSDSKIRSLGILKAAIFVAVFVILLRLFYLNIVTGEKNKALSEGNRVRLLAIEAPRGKIIDRNGKVVAYSLVEYFLKKGEIDTKINEKQVEELEKQGLASENFEGELGKIEMRVQRIYPQGEKMAHVLGYLSGVTEQDLKENKLLTHLDSVGRVGLESSYDNFLRGKNGKKIVEVDAIGRKVSLLGKDPGQPGLDLTISIDSDLQSFAYESLKKNADKAKSSKGAIIIQNPNTGEVLALASYPSFDPENIGTAVTNNNKPFFNRAVQGTYPPGSVFKVVTALAGLESGQITKDTEIEDVGEFYLGNIRFPNWYFLAYGRRDGVLKLDRAIARSNDIFFYRLAERTGLDNLKKTAIKLGFGQKTGIDLPGEQFGLVPDEVWKQASVHESWYPGDTMHLGIGQGFMLVTPMQITQMTSFSASGKLMRPYLTTRIVGSSGETKVSPKIVGENLVNPANLDYVRSGMKLACATGGTGWPFFEAKYTVGCKTGTAEVAEGNPNAWFTAYAPFEKPQIVITVLIEDGGEGSSVAGPVAKEVLDYVLLNPRQAYKPL